MIFVGSRYEFDPVYNIPCGEGDEGSHSHLAVYSNVTNANRALTTDPYRIHVVVDGQRLDQISYTYYGTSEKWWFIADANSDVAYDPSNLTPGMLLRIPNASS